MPQSLIRINDSSARPRPFRLQLAFMAALAALLIAMPLMAVGKVARDVAQVVVPPGFDHDSGLIQAVPFFYLKESGQSISIDELVAGNLPLDNTAWTLATEGQLPERFSDTYYWMATRVHNASGSFQNLVFDFYFPREPYLDVYVVRGAEVVSSFVTGSWRPYSQRPIDYHNFAFPVAIQADETLTLYLHVLNRPLHIVEKSRVLHPIKFLELARESHNRNLFYLGAISTVAIYNLLLAVFVREKTFAYFFLFLLSTIFGTLTYFGIASKVLWPNSSILPHYEIAISSGTFAISLLIFFSNFCDLRKTAPGMNRVLIALTTLAVVPLVLSVVTGQSTVYINFTLGAVIVPILAMAGTCIWLASKGDESAQSLLMAWAVAVAGIAVWIAQRAFHLSNNFFAVEAGQLGLVIVLSVIVVKRITKLREKQQQAQAESRAKSEFLAQMSHEIRNPMNGVLGMTHLLQETNLDSTQRQYANTIDSSASALLVILNDILDVSKMDAGKFRLEHIAFDIRELLQDSTRIFSLQAEEKNLQLSCNIDDEVPPYIFGDPNRIRQVIVNFLSNAFKFTREGSVSVSVCKLSSTPLRLKIAVTDTGVGIPADQQEKLFERFEQLNESVARKYGGTGLGLAICKKLSELMDGEVGVTSAPGSGSTFWMVFTTAEAGEEECRHFEGISETERPGQPLNILVAEDGEVNQVIIRHLIEKLGHRCELVENGARALSRLKQSLNNPGKRIDMVFMDGDMPVMDGLDATRQWRELEATAGIEPVPVIALTAHLLPDYIERCEQSGMNAHLSKPIQLPALQKMIKRFSPRPA